MIKLSLGVLLWSATHLMPSVAPGVKRNLISRLGENPYKGVFTLVIALAIYLIISGWKSTIPEYVYLPPAWGRHATALLVLIGFILFGASHGNNNIRRVIRHPQLTGVLCWGIGHLLANGESRSIVLFGGMTLWALVEIVLINRREGAWARPAPTPIRKDAIAVIAGAVVYGVIAMAHQWLFGFSPFL
jgi:uncharacterized membrane protein